MDKKGDNSRGIISSILETVMLVCFGFSWPLNAIKAYKAGTAKKREQGITDDGCYHYDTPLTVTHETEALFEAGFSSAHVLQN